MGERIKLERVVFREPIDCPGQSSRDGAPPQYPVRDKIVGCYPKPTSMMAKQPYNLFFDPELDAVIVQHPDSREEEEVPRAMVAQWRRLRPQAPKAEAKGKAA